MSKKNSGPFLRGKRGVYYCWIDSHLRSLRTDKPRVAEGVYREMLREWEAEKAKAKLRGCFTVGQVFDAYLASLEGRKPNTIRCRRMILDAFRDDAGVGPLPWDGLAENHLAAWIKAKVSEKGWSASYRRSVINYVQTAFNHCRDHVPESGVTSNPLAKMDKPAWRRRKEGIAPADMARVIASARGSFRLILSVLLETGARPGELCKARIADLRGSTIVLEEHKTDDGGEDRVIYLSTSALEVVRESIGDRTEGAIFLNSRKAPWTPETLHSRFRYLRRKLKLGPGVFPYSVRSHFATKAINDTNMNPALVAKQLGHGNLQMLLKHYLRENPEAMREALDAARGDD